MSNEDVAKFVFFLVVVLPIKAAALWVALNILGSIFGFGHVGYLPCLALAAALGALLTGVSVEETTKT